MPQIINSNINSLTAQRNLNRTQSDQSQALQRLSSGLRINSAKDDAAGLAISTRFDTQVRGLGVAIRNAGDGVSLAQTAEGALGSMTESLQRVRELALQAANGTNSDADREALNAEAQELLAEIGRVSEETNFNGVKLLNGDFQGTSFQIGANQGERIDVSIAAVTTSTLGSAETAGLSSNVSKTGLLAAANDALSNGDLVINGVAVRATAGSDDSASLNHQASSAIAKAAAINEVSDLTGVTATVNANTVEGSIVLDGAAAVTGEALTVNGVTVNVAGKTAAQTTENFLTSVADSINEKAEQTGVTASVVSVAGGYRVDLVAEDGRNINLDSTTLNTSAFGLAALATAGVDETFVGNYTLVSEDGSDITLSTTSGGIDNAGFEEGVYSGSNGGVVGDASDDTNRAALVSGDLTINGVDVGKTVASDDTASSGSNSSSAIALAAAINKITDQTGVTAEANANTLYSAAVGTTAASNTMTINGVNVSYTISTDQSTTVANIIDAVNAKSEATGVTAEVLDSDQYRLVAEDGRNIVIGGTVTDTGLTADTYIGGVTLQSAGRFELGTITGANERAGLAVGTYGGSETGQLLRDVDISTVDGAEDALTAIDNALDAVSRQRANLGAIQNRFETTIANLEINSENLSAANSRIRDADFARETAELSRTQVLQQAGISILAQANQLPQQVLSLLQ